MPFLGGMNLALGVLSLLMLIGYFMDWDRGNDLIILFTCALAHATQFAFNLPHLKGVEKGAPWDVLHGQMLFIFVVDFLGTSLNAIAFVGLYLSQM